MYNSGAFVPNLVRYSSGAAVSLFVLGFECLKVGICSGVVNSFGKLCVAPAILPLRWIDWVGQVCREFRANWGFVAALY